MLAHLIGILAQIQPLSVTAPWPIESSPWRFHWGDSAAYSAPRYDDSSWAIVAVPGLWPAATEERERGFGWYRARYRITLLPTEPLALRIESVRDAYEVYVDGRPVGALGRLPPHPRARSDVPAVFALPISAHQPGEHVIAVRVYSDEAAGGMVGSVELDSFDEARQDAVDRDLTLFAAALLLLGIGIHQTFYWVRRPTAREHLFILLSCLGLACYFVSWMATVKVGLSPLMHWYRLHLAAGAASIAALSAAVRRIFQLDDDRALGWLTRGFVALALLALALPGYQPLRVLARYAADPGALAWAALIATLVVGQWKRGGEHAAPLLWGAGFLLVATLHQVLTDWGASPGHLSWWIVPAGSVAFVASLTMTTAQRFVESETIALYDRLTGLYRREVVMDALAREIQRAARFKQPVSVIMLDLDRFKEVNDTLGHQAGDRVLAEVGRRLAAAGRAVDYLGRYGGEEFVGVLASTDLAGATLAAERLRGSVSALPIDTGRASRAITLSAGVAAYEGGDERPTSEQLVGAADAALYRAKEAGRDRVMSQEDL